MTRKNIALLTSTIAPAAGVLHLKRRNVEERLSDYRRALTFYCECLRRDIFDQLVYADNSGYPLDSLRALAELEGMSSRVEFMSYKSTVPPDTGRLYQELNLVFKALNAATLLQGDVTIWKITGRYIVKNVAAIVADAPGPTSASIAVTIRGLGLTSTLQALLGMRSMRYSGNSWRPTARPTGVGKRPCERPSIPITQQ